MPYVSLLPVASFLLLFSTSVALAADPAVQCEAGKLKEASKYSSCRLKAYAKGVSKNVPPDFAKCEEKFQPKFNAVETKAGTGVCPSEGDAAAIEARITSDASDLATLLSGGSLPSGNCGNGVVDAGEDCDWGTLNGESCTSLGHAYAGTLDCTVGACTFDETGCQSKIAFLTSVNSNGNLGGLAGADAKCNALATAAGLPGTYKAWLAASGVDPANSFTHATVPYVLIDGTVLANDWTDLTDGFLAANLTLKDDGTGIAGPQQVWTGVNTSGTGQIPNCNNWTSASNADSGYTAVQPNTNSAWTQAATRACDQARPFYCFQQ